jgi:hypothetical protein
MRLASRESGWTCLFIFCFAGCSHELSAPAFPAKAPGPDGVYHVYPGEEIQAAIESASRDPNHKTVRVHAGTYRPMKPGQAMIWLNGGHDGITLEADGEVILTAANEAIADRLAPSYPAIVNHVLYIGDGITENTVVRGFTLTGANNFVTTMEGPLPAQPDSALPELQKNLFFYADGGGIKVFGRSYPTILNMTISGNYTSPCGGGVSIEHRGFNQRHVTIKNCIFRDNRAQITGSAVDVLPGSSAVIINCLFVGNVSNNGVNYVGGADAPYNEEHGSGALTVFPNGSVKVDHCTFTGNWNGVDDKGIGNVYTDSIFWMNTKSGGISPGARYELDILDGRMVSGCFLRGDISDLRKTVSLSSNNVEAPDPDFDSSFRPRSPNYADVGYRPDLKD